MPGLMRHKPIAKTGSANTKASMPAQHTSVIISVPEVPKEQLMELLIAKAFARERPLVREVREKLNVHDLPLEQRIELEDPRPFVNEFRKSA